MKLFVLLLATVVVCAMLYEADAAPPRKRRIIIIIVRRRPNRGRREIGENITESMRQFTPPSSLKDQQLSTDADRFLYTGDDTLDEASMTRLCSAVQRETEAQSDGEPVPLDGEILPLVRMNIDAANELSEGEAREVVCKA